MPFPIQGTCRCGQITFESATAPVMTTACHCSGCQKMAASAYSLSALFPAAAFKVTQGEPIIGGLHGATRHYFCPHRLSWLFTRFTETDDVLGVRSALLAHPERYAPFMETWTREKLPWAVTNAQVSFEGFPDPADYPVLMARYASERRTL